MANNYQDYWIKLTKREISQVHSRSAQEELKYLREKVRQSLEDKLEKTTFEVSNLQAKIVSLTEEKGSLQKQLFETESRLQQLRTEFSQLRADYDNSIVFVNARNILGTFIK